MDFSKLLELMFHIAVSALVFTAFRLWWKRRSSALPDTSSLEVESSTDDFFDFPEPREATERLRDYLATTTGENPNNPGWYLFARLAEQNPSLVTQYEELFQRQPSETLLLILAQCGNDETRKMLESMAGRTESMREQISRLVTNWHPHFLRPLETKPTSCVDLDFLWCEFRVTRDLSAVRQIIDVLEWPDWFRGKLSDWLMLASPEEASRCADALFREASVLIDAESREILSRMDLDYTFLMDGMDFSKEHFDSILELLPFPVAKEEIAAAPAMVKASARWSLASHAHKFPEIHELLLEEVKTRTGRCRLALLEVLARTGDFEEMFNWYYAAVHSEHLEKWRSDLAPEWDRLKSLPVEYPKDRELTPLPHGAASRCAVSFEEIRTYRVLQIDQVKENGEFGPALCTWEAEIDRIGRFYVFQRCGDDGDDWFSFPTVHYRGPLYQPGLQTEASDRRRNYLLTSDGYLPLFGVAAARSGVVDAAGRAWWYFEYKGLPFPFRELPGQGEEGSDENTRNLRCDIYLWVDPITAHLRKAITAVDDEVFFSHMFAAYNEPVDIFPPPFTILTKTPENEMSD